MDESSQLNATTRQITSDSELESQPSELNGVTPQFEDQQKPPSMPMANNTENSQKSDDSDGPKRKFTSLEEQAQKKVKLSVVENHPFSVENCLLRPDQVSGSTQPLTSVPASATYGEAHDTNFMPQTQPNASSFHNCRQDQIDCHSNPYLRDNLQQPIQYDQGHTNATPMAQNSSGIVSRDELRPSLEQNYEHGSAVRPSYDKFLLQNNQPHPENKPTTETMLPQFETHMQESQSINEPSHLLQNNFPSTSSGSQPGVYYNNSPNLDTEEGITQAQPPEQQPSGNICSYEETKNTKDIKVEAYAQPQFDVNCTDVHSPNRADFSECQTKEGDSNSRDESVKALQHEQSMEEPPQDENAYEAVNLHEKLKEMGEISVIPKQEANAKIKKEGESEISVEIKQKNAEKYETEDSKRITNLRKNIREVMDENQLDATTLAAQRQESERLARVQEQQKIIRELQRQTATERLNNRTQNRVISLLQGQTSLSKSGSSSTAATNDRNSLAGSSSDMYIVKGVASEVTFKDSGFVDVDKMTSGNLTPSVSIAPVRRSKVADQDIQKETYDKKEVVTIVDSSSDDDCIVLSDDEDDLYTEPEDDPHNSGLHVNDAYNVPDEQGRVVINIGHPENEPDVFLAPQVARIIKPHQIGGVRFLFDNIIESLERFNTSTGFGCILAHSMGLGKTLQLVCFCDIFLRHTSSKSILCIMPINTLQNWVSEFNMWLPEDPESNPLREHGEVRPRNFKLFVLNDQFKTLSARSKVILEWGRQGGVLLIGYELYRLLALKLASKKKKGKKASVEKEKIETEAHKQLMEDIHAALVKPGPDLVICDEGHRIKNSHASISLALKQIRSKRRIVLTGYPLQNNLLEYWCMVDFVRPNYLGTKTEFANMFERPIQNGQCIDSTPQDIKLMRYRAHVLHSLLVGFVQRRSHVVLQNSLPQKEEYVILVRMTPFQRKLYDVFMNEVVRTKAVPNPLKAFAVCCKIWNHPDVLYNFLKKREADLDLELEEVESETSGSNTTAVKVKKKAPVKKGKESNKNEKFIPSIEVSPTQTNNSTESLKEAPKEEKMMENSSDANSSQEAAEKYSQQHSFQVPQHIQPKDHTTSNLSIPQQEQPLEFPSEYENSYHLFNSYGCDNYFGNFNNVFQQSQFANQNYDSNFNPQNSYWQGEMPNYYGYNNPTQITSDQYQNDQTYTNTTNKAQENIDERSSNSDKQSEIVDLDTKEIKTVETTIDPNDIIIPTNSKPLKEPKTETTEIKPEIVEEISIEKVQAKAKEDGIPYDWALDLMKGYIPNLLEISPKMVIFFRLLEESLVLGDRVLVFSQSLLTLNLIEQFLQKNKVPGSDHCWAKNSTYFRLDGSTTAMEREKLINEFNANPQIHLFLVSTRAGSLGINLVGANRVIVFDASWNPCHDTQAVCRVYRYGQRKPCFVYRLVMDNCLEKKIYDRQVNKQGMSDRVVDECNPDAHLSLKEVTNLCYDEEKDDDTKDLSSCKDKYLDTVIQKVIEIHHSLLSKEPFHHESLLVDRKEKKLSMAEKRLAQRGYEMEKRAASKPAYIYNSTGTQYRVMKTPDGGVVHRPVASVRPMQAEVGEKLTYPGRPGGIRPTRWIPAEVWQRQGMTAQEMTLPLDVVIPTSSGDKSNIVLKAGQKVMVLKSPKGIYMQLESGKIIAIRTSLKVGQSKEKSEGNDAGISKNILDADESLKRTSTPEEKKEKSIFMHSNDTSAPSGKFLKKEYGMESSSKNINSIGQNNRSENSDNKVKEFFKTNMKPQQYSASQAVTPTKQSMTKNFLNNKLSVEEGNSSAANAFKKSEDVIMVGTKQQPRNVQSTKQSLCMKTTPMRNFGYNMPMSRQQVGHASPGSFMTVAKPNVGDNKVWAPEKNQASMQSKAIPPTITIDDDFDPPVREKLVYKPNLVERKSKSSNRAVATYSNNQIKKAENRQAIKPPTNHSLPSSTTAKSTEQPCVNAADKTRQTQNVKPYNKFSFEQGQKISTPDLPGMQSTEISDNKANTRQQKMPTIRNIPAPYPSVSTAMVQNAPNPIHTNYQQSNTPHHPESPLTEQDKLAKMETAPSEPSYTALSQHPDPRPGKRDEAIPYPNTADGKEDRNRKFTSNDLGSQNFQNMPALPSTASAPQKENVERTETEYPTKYNQHVGAHGHYMAPPNGPSYLYNRPDLDAYQKCFPGMYNSQPGASYNYPPHPNPSQPAFSYGSFPSHPYNPYGSQQNNPPVSQPSQYYYSGLTGSEPRPPTSDQYNQYYNYYPQQSDQWQ